MFNYYIVIGWRHALRSEWPFIIIIILLSCIVNHHPPPPPPSSSPVALCPLLSPASPLLPSSLLPPPASCPPLLLPLPLPLLLGRPVWPATAPLSQSACCCQQEGGSEEEEPHPAAPAKKARKVSITKAIRHPQRYNYICIIFLVNEPL